MTLSRERRLVNGVWTSVTVDETGGGGGGSVSEVTSDDGTVSVTDPTGPSVDLSATNPGVDPPGSPTDGMLWWDPDDDTPASGVPLVQATYTGSNTVTVANTDSAPVPFDSLNDGTELLDRSTPAAPTFLADGTYAILAQIQCTGPLTAGGFLYGSIEVSSDAFDGFAEGAHPDVVPTQIASIGRCVAGDVLHVQANNYDGVASRDFLLYYCRIVKLA